MISLVIISGRSGSGKSTALNVLEDIGYYCIDNLPVTLLAPLIDRLAKDKSITRAAVGIDVRNIADDLALFPGVINSFNERDVETTVIFLDSNSPALVKRFSETRRKHPLTNENRDLKEALELERSLLDPIAELASLNIDTTSLTIHELRDEIRSRVSKESHKFALQFQSFAYKRGVPVDADIVYDVRCLPNPHWVPDLRALTGMDQPVQDFLGKQPEFTEMFEDIHAYLQKWLPRFQANNRSYLTIAVGCTGGQHRSVFMCKMLHETFSTSYPNVQLRHRELDRATG